MFTLNCKGSLIVLDAPVVMGIINVTPDSFFSWSRNIHTEDIVRQAEKMIGAGAAIIDIGGQSTRPGSSIVSADEEIERILPAVKAIHQHFPDQVISIDTYYGKVAKAAVEVGASMINDISAGSLDDELLPAVAALKVPYILMHMKGTPQTMQQQTTYNDVTLDVFDFLNFKIAALTAIGITDVIIDPGFGFSKNVQQNFQLLHKLSYFKQLGRPILAGLSRKSTVYKTLGITAEEALNGTTVLHTIALLNGANILRVHDVKEAMEAIALTSVYAKQKEQP